MSSFSLHCSATTSTSPAQPPTLAVPLTGPTITEPTASTGQPHALTRCDGSNGRVTYTAIGVKVTLVQRFGPDVDPSVGLGGAYQVPNFRPTPFRLNVFFFLNDPPPPEISPLPLHHPLPI